MPVRPSSSSVACAGTRKRSCQTTSLASSRRACVESCSPAAVAFFESSAFVALKVSEQPLHAADPELERLDRVLVGGPQRPRDVEALRALHVLLLLAGSGRSACVSSSACLRPGVVSSSPRSVPILAELEPTPPISAM